MQNFQYISAKELNSYLNPKRARTFIFDVNLDSLEAGYKKAVPKLLKALVIIDELFLIQDNPQSLSIKNRLVKDSKNGSKIAKLSLEVFNIFNGPEGVTYENKTVPLFKGINERPKGGAVYDSDITAKDIENYLKNNPKEAENINKMNTIIRKDGKNFIAIPYEKEYSKQLKEIASLLESASKDVTDKDFSEYLKSRAHALTSGDYFESDVKWVKSTESQIDIGIGPLESYYDEILSKKSFYSGFLVVKNKKESERVQKYINYLQELEELLPQNKNRCKNMKNTNLPIAVVDILFMAGDAQAKRPGIVLGQTLPNDEKVLKKIGRKIFINKNVLEGFEPNKELLNKLIDPKLHIYSKVRGKVNFTISHEVSHSLGPKLTNKLDHNKKVITVETALGFWSGIIEELKADLLGGYNMEHLLKKGLYDKIEVNEVYFETCLINNLCQNKPNIEKDTHYVGRLMKFNYFLKNEGIFTKKGRFNMDFELLTKLTKNLLKEILDIQYNGDKKRAEEIVKKWAYWSKESEYAAKTMKKCNVKLYKIVKQPAAEAILNKNK